jgi:AcrR family transcriptional regulator
VLDAAADRFRADGYAGTTVDAIARDAGVAPQTVYNQFGSKASIARELLEEAGFGGDGQTAVADLPWYRPVFEHGIDGQERLRRYARGCRYVNERSAEAAEVVRRAADADPELAGTWRSDRAGRRRAADAALHAALASATLRPELTRRRAVDAVAHLGGPETYHALVVEAGWTGPQYERWLATTLADLVAP